MKRRIVKLGGSLLSFGPLVDAWRTWYSLQPVAETLIVVGGGSYVDRVQAEAERVPIGESDLHWRCIEAMSHSAHEFAERAGLAKVILLREFLSPPSSPMVVDILRWMREIEPTLSGERLPPSAAVTSDSIAARLAGAIGADELVLLKSTSAPTGSTLRAWCQAGFVDPWFETVARDLPLIRAVHLRDDRAFAAEIRQQKWPRQT